MIKRILLLLVIFSLAACKNDTNKPREVSSYVERIQNRFPSTLQKVFNAHGGLSNWKSTNTIAFSIDSLGNTETHTADLKSRKILIESDNYSLGFDGENIWITDPNKSFKSNPSFYYNLMFYLYTMPFIISDPDIFYTQRNDTNLKFETYGAIHIGFSRSVGDSPQDEYIIYYNKETFEMVWLAYTVTYFNKKRNNDWRYIKYEDWQTVNGLKVPKTLVWYDVKNDKPDNAMRKVDFFDVKISEKKLDDNYFKAGKNSKYVQ